MLTKEDAELIIGIISDDSEPLSKVSDRFDATFKPDKSLTVLTSLSALLTEGILEEAQQVVVVWLIYKAYGQEPSQQNPFSDVLSFVYSKCSSNTTKFSAKVGEIAGAILSSTKIDTLGEHSVSEFLEPNFECGFTNDIEDASFPSGVRNSPIIISKADQKAAQISPHQLLKELLIEPLIWPDFEIPFYRTTPELTPTSDEELQFSMITTSSDMPYIFDDEQAINKKNAAKYLINEAKERQLSSWQEECVVEEASKDKSLLSDVRLSKSDVQRVMDINPKVGGMLYAELARKDNKLFDEFAKMDINDASLSIVKYVMINLKPPNSFLNNFIANAAKIISSTKDQATLRNKTKMLCDLVIYLNENKVEFMSMALIELQSLQETLQKKGITEANALSTLFE